jgi:hypothetical protein
MTGPIKFSPGNHRYWMDKKPVQGVTTIIKQGLPAPALMYWSAKTVAEWVAAHPGITDQMAALGGPGPLTAFLKEVPWQKRDDAGARGTEVHRLGEQLVHGTPVEVPQHLLGYVEGYARWLDEWQCRPILVERMVGNREHWYAGCFDLVAEIDSTIWLLDLKTASGVYGENALQTDAYRNAEFWQDDDGLEQPLPTCERLGVLHVQDGETRLVPLVSDGSAFRDFLKVKQVADCAKGIKGYVGEALVRETAVWGAA